MYKFNDLTGMAFGRLKVIEQNGRTSDRHILWKCKCECGKFTNVSSRELRSGKTKSCGCLQKDKIRDMRGEHK